MGTLIVVVYIARPGQMRVQLSDTSLRLGNRNMPRERDMKDSQLTLRPTACLLHPFCTLSDCASRSAEAAGGDVVALRP